MKLDIRDETQLLSIRVQELQMAGQPYYHLIEQAAAENADDPEYFLKHFGDNTIRAIATVALHRLGLLDKVSDETVGWVWDGAHHVLSQLYDEFGEILDDRALLYVDATPADFQALPETLHLYRGYDADGGRRLGLSWTLDRIVAEKFAKGVQGKTHSRPTVVEAKLPKHCIAALVLGRNESEVVVTQSGHHALELVR